MKKDKKKKKKKKKSESDDEAVEVKEEPDSDDEVIHWIVIWKVENIFKKCFDFQFWETNWIGNEKQIRFLPPRRKTCKVENQFTCAASGRIY